MKQFQQNMQEQQRGQDQGVKENTSQKSAASDKGDYIDFEEIKS